MEAGVGVPVGVAVGTGVADGVGVGVGVGDGAGEADGTADGAVVIVGIADATKPLGTPVGTGLTDGPLGRTTRSFEHPANPATPEQTRKAASRKRVPRDKVSSTTQTGLRM